MSSSSCSSAAPRASRRRGTARRLAPRRALVDLAAGDRLTGVFLPGHGMRLYRGDMLQADVADDAFARAFFSIWLDPRARAPDLRTRLPGARG